jgi:hypothetical protein
MDADMQAMIATQLAIEPALAWADVFGVRSSDPARMALLAIGHQESGFTRRRQFGGGPARGLWQFEPNGVEGVLSHARTARVAYEMCVDCLVQPTVMAVHEAIEFHDVLACGFARLLLWSDPVPLPTSADGMWALYLRTWRPGKPHRDRWDRSWEVAANVVSSRAAVAPLG